MKRAVALVAAVLGGAMFGGGLGLLVLKSRPRTGMGWDQIADGLGALALGGLLGCLVCGFLVAWVEERRAAPIGWTLLVLGPVLLVLAARAPSRPAEEAPQQPPFEPIFVVQMFSRIPAADPGPPAGIGDFPHRELRVDARSRRLTSKSWGPAAQRGYCAAELDDRSLQQLAEHAEAVFEEGVENCPSAGRATFSVTVEWAGETRGAASFGLACLEDQTRMSELLETFGSVHARVCG